MREVFVEVIVRSHTGTDRERRAYADAATWAVQKVADDANIFCAVKRTRRKIQERSFVRHMLKNGFFKSR